MLRKARLSILLLIVGLIALLPGTRALSAPGAEGGQAHPFSFEEEDTPYVPGRLIVRFAPGTSDEEKAALHERLGAQVIEEIPELGIQILEIPEEATNMVFAYQQEPTVAYAEPDYLVHLLGWPDGPLLSGTDLAELVGAGIQWTPNDVYFPQMWNLARIQAPAAWDITHGSPDVVIAVIDTGVDPAHEDLRGDKIIAGYDFVNNDNDPNDDQGHGTHVAGTAAAVTNNAIGIAGVGYEVKIMPVKALSSTGSGSHSWIARAIIWATHQGADVINMSLGGPYTSSVMRDAVNYAWSHGVVIVAAAGNESTSNPTYPAAYENVIGVSATTQNDQRAGFSNYGNYISVAAPGVSILSTVRGNNYQAWSGTSMASPHVAGLAALLKSIHPDWTNAQIRETIESSADDLGSPGWDRIFGSGRINAYGAVVSAPPPATPTPTPVTPTPTATPEPPPGAVEPLLIAAINQARVEQGLPALRRDGQLMEAARRHSRDMAENDFCDHYGSDGSDPFDRMRDAGYPLESGSEVIACGYGSVDAVVQGWLDSPTHRAIILNSNLYDIGCGYAEGTTELRYYWTCNLARSSGTRTPAPTPTSTPEQPTATPTVTPSPTPVETTVPEPTPIPGSTTVPLTPAPNAVGWVVSTEPDDNHFGDDDIYTGIHTNRIYLGAMQFDLSSIPANANIHWARLEMTGQSRAYTASHGSWAVWLLKPTIDANWSNHGYTTIRNAEAKTLILPILGSTNLDRNKTNVFVLTGNEIAALETRLKTTHAVSFRINGPDSGENDLFSWDSGYGTGGLGIPPVLTINYTLTEDVTPTPAETITPATSTPTPELIEDYVDLVPREKKVGWVASHEPSQNHFGDDDIYAGYYAGNTYLGAIQFDLSSLSGNAELLGAELRITGQTRSYLLDTGSWVVEMLDSSVDAGWSNHGYTPISQATSVGQLVDLDDGDQTLASNQLDVGRMNRLGLTTPLIAELNARLHSTKLVSFRIRGPNDGTNNVFSWDSGYGTGGLGVKPILRITYATGSGPSPSPTPVPELPSPTPTPPADDKIMEMIQSINQARIDRGLSPLNPDRRLAQAAQAHSLDLANNNHWSHNGTDGSTPQERMRRAGYPLGQGDEVLAANSVDVEAILRAWLANPRHERILMNPEYVDIGVGYAYNANSAYGHYWTVNVAFPEGSGTPGQRVTLTPQETEVGWVASHEPTRNHFGDDDIYSGVYGGRRYLGAIRFSLSLVPPTAHITGAELRLTGQTREYLGTDGTWTVHMLAAAVDNDWKNHGYTEIANVASLGIAGQPLQNSDLDASRVNQLILDSSLLNEVQNRLGTTGYVSFRIEGPADGTDNIFSWDSGYGTGGLGARPVLAITYTMP